MTKKEKMKSDALTLWLYLCGFLLLWEWLRPLEQLTDTNNVGVFIGFLVLSLVLSYFQVHILARSGIRLLYVVYTINFLYYVGPFFQFKWIGILTSDLIENIGLVFHGEWTALSDSFRSLLFYLLLVLMTYLLRYWLVHRKQIFVFFFMTLVYITVLDTFTPYDATYAIVRIIILGFALMGILTFYRIMDREKWQRQPGFVRKWLAPLVVMVCASVLIGYAAPKASPIWPDPVPYITSYSEKVDNNGPGGLSKVGYGTDDTKLGGPFNPDDTVVYETEVDSRQYWKVETKDEYTGKGWVASVENGIRTPFTQEDTYPFTNYLDPEMEVTKRTAIIKPKVGYPHLIYPLGLTAVKDGSGSTFEIEENLEKIYLVDNDASGMGEYVVEYDAPKFSVKAMKSTVDTSNPVLTEEFLTQYTQLPEELPQRVRDLAVEITKDQTNWYDKAKAVENYFDRADFQYDQKNVATPGRTEDYVDQFLFDTQRGYCDNFSTSMVVLMRSIGIPARWVKGYTEGAFRGLSENDQRTYVVTNNNAHSWVEVFFPEVGWVPFEPTKGYSNNAQFNFDDVSEETDKKDELEAPVAPKPEKPEAKEATTQPKKTEFSWKQLWVGTKDFFNKHWGWILGAFLSIAAIAYLLYETRIKWLPHYLVFRFRRRKKDEDFPDAYFALLNQLNRYGLKRKQAQTLRDYAEYIDEYFSTKEMGALTANYERFLYKGKLEEGSWEHTRELWENLIKKTTS
ncbi:DUF4129 domain-containing transglutaminase family protein [Robertmurraya sp. Marseille-Q9965]